MQATYVKDLTGFSGTAKLWKLDEPLQYPECYGDECFHCNDGGHNTTEYVISSATVAMFSGPEVYIFPADDGGQILDWLEMKGSYRGDLDHQTAINGLVA